MPTIIRNGITYGGGGGTGNASNKYSTEEQVIGTWIDGKPLYRVVITNETAAGLTIDISRFNIKDIVYLDGWLVNGTGGAMISVCSGLHSRITETLNNNSSLKFTTGNSSDLVKYFIIDYTKTTD